MRLNSTSREEESNHEALIDLLYQEDTASDEMKALKHEVEEKQAVLQCSCTVRKQATENKR